MTLGYRDSQNYDVTSGLASGDRIVAERRALPSVHAEPMSDEPIAGRAAADRLVLHQPDRRAQPRAADPRRVADGAADRRRHPRLEPAAGRCLSRPVAADGVDHHAMARPFGRRSGTADHRSDRARDERHPEGEQSPLGLALRVCRASTSPSTRTPTAISRGSRCSTASPASTCRAESRPTVEPLTSPSGLIYRYTLQSPDRSPTELKTFEDWTVEPQFRSVSGRCRRFRVRRRDDAVSGAARPISPRRRGPVAAAGRERARRQQRQRRRRILFAKAANSITSAASAGCQTLDDIGNVVVAVHDGIPTLVKDVGAGHARHRAAARPVRNRQAERRRRRRHHAAHRREDAGRAEAASKRRRSELNTSILPKDVKVVPFYDRSDLVHETVVTVENNLLRGMLLVVVILIFFLYDVRSGLIVAVTIPLSLAVRLRLPRPAGRVGEPAVDRRDRLRDPRRCRGDHGREYLPTAGRERGATRTMSWQSSATRRPKSTGRSSIRSS